MKTPRFSWPLLFPLIVFVASSTHADTLQVISSSRYVSVSGFAGADDGSMNYSDQKPANATVSGSAQWTDGNHGVNSANSSATQNSSLGAESFSALTALSVFEAAPSILAGGTGQAQADAQSYFEVTFSVLTPVTYNLAFPGAGQNDFSGNIGQGGTVSATFVLSSLAAGTILSLTNTYNYPFGAQFSGSLIPGDTYTIIYAEHLTALTDPFSKDGQMSGNFVFAVPEASEIVLFLLGAASLGLVNAAHRIGCAKVSASHPGACCKPYPRRASSDRSL